MAGINKVILVGNLGKDPEIRTLDGGVKRASFSVATTEYYKNKAGEKVEQTEWHYIVAWRNLADIVEKILKKGCTIYLEGKIQSRKWTDQAGQEKKATEIIADVIQIIKSPANSSAGTSNQQSSSNATPNANESSFIPSSSSDDDLPF